MVFFGSDVEQRFRDIEDELGQLPEGSSFISGPGLLEVGESGTVFVQVDPMHAGSGDTRLTPRMAMRLTGVGVHIQPITNEVQAVTLSEPTVWSWQVVGETTGEHDLVAVGEVILSDGSRRTEMRATLRIAVRRALFENIAAWLETWKVRDWLVALGLRLSC
jgi:hypothetical protein